MRLHKILEFIIDRKLFIKIFRIIAFIEGLSFMILLFITVPLKYIFDMYTPNIIIGKIHGGLYILYIILLLDIFFKSDNWNAKVFWKCVFLGIIPFGTIWADKKYFNRIQ
ncbi:MAG: DUF3817 domain-containing protein [Chitinophagaceae bacterium]|nr:DUF3817 domain-containing protein [Chitinophagaceae bacterium]